MSKQAYEVFARQSGQSFGVYTADSAEAAVAAMLEDGEPGEAAHADAFYAESLADTYAADWSKWAEYVDPNGAYTREEFDAMPMPERVKLAAEVIAANA